jgi:hypothetical protein
MIGKTISGIMYICLYNDGLSRAGFGVIIAIVQSRQKTEEKKGGCCNVFHF